MPDIAAQIELDRILESAKVIELTELQAARARNRIDAFFLAEGQYRRELYPKHIKFFAAGGRHNPMPECPPGCDGKLHRERCLLAANRTGKTVAASFETTCHLTGIYPDWWPGYRFEKPIVA
jgi:hypothetical protein